MVDEHKLIRDVEAASRAKSLLEDGLIVGAFESLEQAYIERWRVTHIDDEKGREKLFLAVNVVGKVRQHFQTIINSGTLAEKTLNDLAQQAEREAVRKKRFGII